MSLRCKTEAGLLVIVLFGKPLKAKGSGDITSFEFKLILHILNFALVQWFHYFFKILLEKSYPFSFALLTRFQLFPCVHVFF